MKYLEYHIFDDQIKITDHETQIVYSVIQHKKLKPNERYYTHEYQVMASNGYDTFEGREKILTLMSALREVIRLVRQERSDLLTERDLL